MANTTLRKKNRAEKKIPHFYILVIFGQIMCQILILKSLSISLEKFIAINYDMNSPGN